VLRDLPVVTDDRLLIGRESGDDAAVYTLGPGQAVVFTTDALTPLVDDPFEFGQIVAANCLSDVWAMGGHVLMALNIAGFPQGKLPLEVLGDILRGGVAKAAEAGVPVAGGHTMRSPEPFYGLAVVGLIDPARVVSNAGAQPGDALLLTKPLGTGHVVTAMRYDQASAEHHAACVASMSTLNKRAAEIMLQHGVHAATDVTGFGLVGHGHGLADASGVALELAWEALPILPGAVDYARAGNVTGAGLDNLDHYGQWADFGDATEELIAVACDAQTSGGLLMALPADQAPVALEQMQAEGMGAALIGKVVEGDAGMLQFR
jgi:selenide,water dikinase